MNDLQVLFISPQIVVCEPQIFGLRAGWSLPFFESSGFGRARVGQNLLRTSGRAGIYGLPSPNLGIELDRAYIFF